MKDGDIVNIDFTVKKDGFIGDTSIMVMIGTPKPWVERLVNVTQECLHKAIRLVKSGVTLGDIDYVIQQYAESEGYSVVREFGGHVGFFPRKCIIF